MNKISRRQLARYAVDQLIAGRPAAKLWRQLAATLISNRQAGAAGLLANDIVSELEARGKFASAKVTSAHALSPKSRDRLIKAIKQAAKVETVKLETAIDKEVLGGLRVETAIHSWDDTIARRLDDLKGAA